MSGTLGDKSGTEATSATADYRPPTITYLGTLADLTRKQVGAADGQTFLGLDIGSV